VRIVVNERFAKGLSESVRVGLAATASRSTAAAILLGDQPQVSTDLIDRILAAHASSGKAATRPIFGTKGDEPTPGHPVLLSRSLWRSLRELRGDEGARALLAANTALVNELRIVAMPPADIDTPADYDEATKQTATGGRKA
jgi:molybdenum cofactor cytidylyltransferase